MADIINLAHYTDALRNTGYKNVESAVAEIIDNSLEAEAKDILIICDLHTEVDSVSKSKEIRDIAILDNGTGMDIPTLNICLSLGDSTRRDRKGIGRFGVGLPQASLFIAPKVEVYSWQNGVDNSYYVYLDINEIKDGKQKVIQNAQRKNVPHEYESIIKHMQLPGSATLGKMNFANKGTLVIWKDCDKLYPKTPNTLFNRFEFYLGRKFRYFLQEGDDRKIGLMLRNNDSRDTLIKPNDPLYLMENNQLKGDRSIGRPSIPGESIFEPWVNLDIPGEVTIPIPYIRNKQQLTANVIVKFSIAKKEFQEEGGAGEIGKHAKRNAGISIIRSKREIDFGKFDFFSDVNEPQHRWWGCEISFPTELDEVFKVANNKQQIQLFKPDSVDEEPDNGVWTLLNGIVGAQISAMKDTLKKRRVGSRTKGNSFSIEERIVNRVEENNPIQTESQQKRSNLNEGDIERSIEEKLIDLDNPEPSPAEIELVKNNKVNIKFEDLRNDDSKFIDISVEGGVCYLIINLSSLFYKELYSSIESDADPIILQKFNLFLMSFARSEDEARNKKVSYSEVREAWGEKIKKYLQDFKA